MKRKTIYYWKSDRAFATENTSKTALASRIELIPQIKDYLTRFFTTEEVRITPGGGQGNHITFIAHYSNRDYFVRLENGPEEDDYMAVESIVMEMVRQKGVPCPQVHFTDVSRKHAPFAIQVMEFIKDKDLNRLTRDQHIDTIGIANQIGAYIGKWQEIELPGFGLFNSAMAEKVQRLEGYHGNYKHYFLLNWEQHLHYLKTSGFIDNTRHKSMTDLVIAHESLLNISKGCLVHKDLAFWNVLGDRHRITAFIDWNDAISGDPADDLSLLACFHPGKVVVAAIEGYTTVRKLPENFEERFWLHLLRNMIFKAVIRVRGNYFDLPDNFFMNNGQENNLRQETADRIDIACKGLMGNQKIWNL